MAKRLLNPYYDGRTQLGFSWPAFKQAILNDMAAHPEKEEYTLAEIVQIAVTSGVVTDTQDLRIEMLDWLDAETDINVRII